MNGIFAWLRNAIFNPVAALPWLFLVIECLLSAAVDEVPWRRRAGIASLGGGLCALAVYAGFPEEVYLYGLMLAAWIAFRMTRLDARANSRLFADLALMGVLGLLLSARSWSRSRVISPRPMSAATASRGSPCPGWNPRRRCRTSPPTSTGGCSPPPSRPSTAS